MNRAVATSLAAVVVGTGLALGQGRSTPPAQEEPSPPSSVIKLGPTDRPAFGTKPNEKPKDDEKKPIHKKRTPPPFVIRNGSRMEEPSPPPTVIRKDAPKPTPAKKEPEFKSTTATKGPELKPAPAKKDTTVRPVTKTRDFESQPAKPKAPVRVVEKQVVDAKAVDRKMPVVKKDSPAATKESETEIRFPIRPSAYQEPAPAPPAPSSSSPITIGQPQPPVLVPPTTPTPKPMPIIPPEIKPIEKPIEKIIEKPTPVEEPTGDEPLPLSAIDKNAVARYPNYATNLIQPHFPWTKCGRRVCGSLYVDTPYLWMDASYLWGWTKQDHAPALLTLGAVNSANPGALGDPGTTVLFDGQRIQDEPYHGGKFVLGTWLDECQYCGLEGGYFFFASQDRGLVYGANGYPGEPGLYVPYFNPISGVEEAFPVAVPGEANGVVNINSRTRVQGADGHFLFSFARNMRFRMDAIAGVRWLGLDEDLTLEENVRQGPGNGFAVSSDVGISDHFGTRTDFIGADFGFKSHFERNAWSLDILTRVAFGGNHQTFRGDGTTSIKFDLPDFPIVTTQGGRYIGPANNGIFTNDKFSIVPEVGVSMGYMPTHWFKFTVGYNWVYWTDVIRVGAQVDRVINPIGVPTSPQYQSNIYEPRRPGVAFNESDIWLQSITLGMQFMY